MKHTVKIAAHHRRDSASLRFFCSKPGRLGTIEGMKTTNSKHSTNRLALLISLISLACFVFSPQAHATCEEGCDTVSLDTFLGEDALSSNTTGHNNTAIGYRAIYSNTVGSQNTAIGTRALYSSPFGNSNTAIGNAALYSDTYGVNNVAIGVSALYSNSTGYQNTATGTLALHTNTIGYNNTADGYFALQSNGSGCSNAAAGFCALVNNSTGNNNTGDGYEALQNNTTGNTNIALGFQAGQNLTTGDNNIDIGNLGVSGESNTIRIGTAGTQSATFISGISGVPLTHGTAVAVGITADGQLGVRASSAKFKEAVKPMDKASEAILSLKPVTFRYKKELDSKGTPQFGLIAEEVAKVDHDLVVTDDRGKPFTVRYEEVNAMLLNEFLKAHSKIEDQQAQLQKQDKEIEELKAAVKELQASRSN